MFLVDTSRQLHGLPSATISKVLLPVFLVALLTVFLPVVFLGALGDFLWFRFHTVLRNPQPPKAIWEF